MIERIIMLDIGRSEVGEPNVAQPGGRLEAVR